MKPQDQCEPKGIHCILCKEDHFHLFECRNFQSMSHEQRIGLAIFLKVCFRCLRNDSQVFRADLTGWFEDHLKNCNGEYQCMDGMCAPEPGRDAWRQRHIVMCEYHSETNKGKIKDFINTLDKSKSIDKNQDSIDMDFKKLGLSPTQYHQLNQRYPNSNANTIEKE